MKLPSKNENHLSLYKAITTETWNLLVLVVMGSIELVHLPWESEQMVSLLSFHQARIEARQKSEFRHNGAKQNVHMCKACSPLSHNINLSGLGTSCWRELLHSLLNQELLSQGTMLGPKEVLVMMQHFSVCGHGYGPLSTFDQDADWMGTEAGISSHH